MFLSGNPTTSVGGGCQQYTFFMPQLDIQSIGSGGGSVIWIDELSGTMKVGPQSAEAGPGPACYNRGGTEPTITDVNLILGYLNPSNFLGEKFSPDVDSSRRAMQTVADRLGMDMSVVSAAPALTLLQTIALAGLVISKMLACSSDEDMRSEVQSCMGAAMYPVLAFSGIDQRGAPYASFLLDPVGAALAGSPWRDGVDTGGWPWDLQSTMPNVEDNEWFYPILYLWRKELANSGGAGKFRGGNSAEIAFVPHGTDHISLFTASGHCAVPGPGLHGGLSPATTRYTVKRGANVAEQIQASQTMPTLVTELGGETERVPPKAFDIPQTPADAFLLSWTGAGGYGDPLERDPERVIHDLEGRSVTPEWAQEVYGVVLQTTNGKLHVDAHATEVQRAQLRQARLAQAISATSVTSQTHKKLDTSAARPVSDGLVLVDSSLVCRSCEHEICAVTENYKLHCALTEQAITAANPYILDPKVYVDDEMVFRSYACPSCGLLIQTEMSRPTDPPLWDIQLAE